MNWDQIYLDTFIPELPRHWNNNFASVKRYLDVFYDGSLGIIIKPVNTTGRVKAARGEFVTAVVDNLIVKNQFTNLYDNTTSVDGDFYNTYIGADVSTRAADPSLWENTSFAYVDVNKPYYKITNDISTAFLCSTMGQEFQILFDISTNTAPYNILLDPSIGGTFQVLSIAYADAPTTWIKLIAVDYDPSYGTTWAVKQYGGYFELYLGDQDLV